MCHSTKWQTVMKGNVSTLGRSREAEYVVWVQRVKWRDEECGKRKEDDGDGSGGEREEDVRVYGCSERRPRKKDLREGLWVQWRKACL